MDKESVPKSRDKAEILNWVSLRKLETFVFGFLFLALPFFFFRVVEATTATMSIGNVASNLVQDLIKWKKTAGEKVALITVTSRTDIGSGSAYVIEENDKLVEQVLLPAGVSIVGSVTFNPGGTPKAPATFIISKGQRSSHVEVDGKGLISTP
jgi:hypothetical protein